MKKPMILIVDDISENIEILVNILNHYDITVSIDGKGAIEIAQNSHIDMILLDIMMPEMNGFEVCEALKKSEKTKHIPVIFITAKTDENSVETAYNLGGIDYITKPFKPIEVIAKVKTHLQIQNMIHNLENVVEEEIQKRKEQTKMLEQQAKMASMGEMMDAVAHQWKQPLNALSLYSQLIKSDFEEGLINQAYIENFSQDIELQINHMVNTLDEFRTFFRPNKESETFMFSEVIDSVQVLIKDEFLKHRIVIRTIIYDTIEIYGSRNEFKHLLLNILNNAKDAFVENNILKRIITIKLKKVEEKSVIEIEDNAGGIPKEILPNIFKANVTSKEEGKGTGIGLYMSSQIAQKHSAVLSVKNVNEGACFKIEF